MLPLYQILSTLAYFAIAGCFLSYFYKGSFGAMRTKKLWISIVVVLSLGAIKLGYDSQYILENNYYRILDVNRHADVFEIRQAYKHFALKNHPDKNPSPESFQLFDNGRISYEILIDESQRDAYNKFGTQGVKFDPRLDDLKLLVDVGGTYFLWIFLGVLFTWPADCSLGRTWLIIFGIVFLALECTVAFTAAQIPEFNSSLTEYEVKMIVHSLIPVIIAIFTVLSKTYYVDVDAVTIEALNHLIRSQEKIAQLLVMTQSALDSAISSPKETTLGEVHGKLGQLRSTIESSTSETFVLVETLVKSSSSLGSNYYWVIFVLFYVGAFLLQ